MNKPNRCRGKVPRSNMNGGAARIMEHVSLADRRRSHRGWDIVPEHRLLPNVIFTPNTGCTTHRDFREGCSWCARVQVILASHAS